MPAYRKRKFKRKVLGRRSRVVRRVQIQRTIGFKGVHSFKRTCILNTPANYNLLSGSVVGGQGNGIVQNAAFDEWHLHTGANNTTNNTLYSMGLAFSMDMLPDYTEFTTLFDQYRIKKAIIRFRTWATSNGVEANGANNNPQLAALMFSQLDYDDNTAPPVSTAGINQMREYDSFRTNNFITKYKPLKMSCTPRIAMAAYGGGVFSSYANMKAPWIDANSPSVQHYGMKFLWNVIAPGAAIDYNLFFIPEVTLYFECKNTR